ncbi:transporter substrate-binding domain-containing protein [Rubellicoccus peritrichatus]|uniref:Transporter substrate-binding domain-containing protein n=1 Tax=Rubellicoccus peritrichatus TaxID=3080537 RepID=A0AAQ3L9Z0_9BACT|nr:transporter substrate-binding domain-containing protein [Puniceicoccus sp. CR14]WOO41561.1 transporter substrate-binding domain-containing protein [Puniceicoccus sp. CR14]
MTRRSLFRLVSLLLLFIFAGAFQLTAQPTAPEFNEPGIGRIMRVGVAPTGPPIIFKQGDKYSGIEADLARNFAGSIDKYVKFVELPFNDLIPALLNGKIDIIMSGMSYTEMRAIRINFSQPYLKVGQMPLVRIEDVSKYPSTLALLNTKGKIGVEYGTTGDFLVQENFLYAERVPYQDIAKAPDDLVAGKIDMFIYDSPVIWWLASEYEAKGLAPLVVPLSEEFLAWGIRKDDSQLLAQANAFLEEYRESGELQKIIKKWMPYAKL